MVGRTPNEDEPPQLSWFDDAVERLSREGIYSFQLSEEGNPACYEAAIRVMLNIPAEVIVEQLTIPRQDISLIEMIYVADTNPRHPGIAYLGPEVVTAARRSYLTARGRLLWEQEYGTMTPRELGFLAATVEASLLDNAQKCDVPTVSDPELEDFEMRLSLLILHGQQRIMNDVAKGANHTLLQLMAQHQEILTQQLQLLHTLRSMRDPSSKR